MSRILAATAVLLSISAPAAAAAAESSTLAIEAGFLLGHAQRCGVEAARIEAVAAPIRRAIAAASAGDREKESAGFRFTLMFAASAFAGADAHGPVPQCDRILAQFERLERRQREVGSE